MRALNARAPCPRAPARRVQRVRRRPVPAGFDDIDAVSELVDEDDYAKWRRTDPDASAWTNFASSAGDGGTYTVGKRPLDEKFLSETLLALLRNHRRGLRAEVLLRKLGGNLDLDGYKSVLVGIGRMEQWELAREVIDFVRAEGRERADEVVTSNWFMALATRRLEEQAYDATCDVFDYMKEFGSKPSGEAIEVFARLTSLKRNEHHFMRRYLSRMRRDAEPFMTQAQRDRVRGIAEWLSTSDAGRALWHIHFGDPTAQYQPGAPGTVTPNRTISVAMESENIDLYGDIDKLREQLKDFY